MPSRKSTPQQVAAPSDSKSVSASWSDDAQPDTSWCIVANESGVDVSHSSGPSHYDQGGRFYSWEEWFDSGCAGLNPPEGTLTKIEKLAKGFGKKVPKRVDLGPVTKRADLEETRSEEERRQSRLDAIFPRNR